MHFVTDPLANPVKIPWVLEGAFLISLVGAHVSASTLHANQCREWRLETAMTGHSAHKGVRSCFVRVDFVEWNKHE